ncbi:hypothetical protein PUR32_02805, partial [Streptomyces sp. BE133]|nr:hypothetical protein [Streptomyces sp. BE133]
AGHVRYLGVGPGARLAQVASASFDTYGWEWLMALRSGSALVVFGRETVLVEAVPAFLTAQRVSHATDAADPCPPPATAPRPRGRRLFNANAPTETTVDAT